MIIGVVADDLTGANDIGVMFSKGGCPAAVFTWEMGEPLDPSTLAALPQGACILNTNSRLDAPELAYQKVYQAVLALKKAGFTRFYNKTCSVFRGNIGAEFDAMLDALGLEFAVVVLGFPANGRITRQGKHYVHGRLLEESEFRRDPIHPMLKSGLVEILSEQTRRRVGLLTEEVVRGGWQLLRVCIAEMKKECSYLILDVDSQEALATIARAVWDEPVLCGSSALAEELPRAWAESGSLTKLAPPANRIASEAGGLAAPAAQGVLAVCGSLMPQSLAQTAHLKQRGLPAFELDGPRLFTDQSAAYLEALTSAIAAELEKGRNVLFHTAQNQQDVELTLCAGQATGLTRREVSRRVSQAVAEVTAQSLLALGQDRLVVAGGETSAAVCDRLRVKGMQVWREIEPGLPACISIPTADSPRPLLLVLKSGSFGSDHFLEDALQVARRGVVSLGE